MNVQIQGRVGMTFSKAFKMLREGVGFITDDRKSYEVYSHEGDYLGKIPRIIVIAVQAYVKERFGVQTGTIIGDRDRHHGHPPVTYGWTRTQNEWKPGDWIVLNGDPKTEDK